MKIKFCKLLFVALFYNCIVSANTSIKLNLNTGWQFQHNNVWYNTTVPNSIHTDLFNNKLIPDPFFADNESKLQWIGQQQWQYKTVFAIDEGILEKQKIELTFKGLDTYCKVYVNNTLVLEANNMFREWKTDCKELIIAGDNQLLIVFESTELISKKLYDEYNIKKLPGEERIMTRKAQYHYGWDFAPRFITCGIWRDVELTAWDYFIFQDISFQTDSLRNDSAFVTGRAQLSATENSDFLLSVTDKTTGNRLVYAQTIIEQGENNFSFNFSIASAKLWWCNGEGEQHQYSLFVEGTDNKERWSSIETKFGVRVVKVIQKPDADGTSFYFEINGKPVFMKGANYVPQDVFLNRVNEEKYNSLLSDVKNSGMNMLRVWGGGIYENDVFYRLCDEKGILVWQDFMFACAMYPFDDNFLENVKEEALQNVKRLNKFASVAMWCGNNENNEGWHRWGWQNDYDSLQRQSIWSGYQRLFNEILSQSVTENSNLFYWESSPKFGRGDLRHVSEGDAHNWFVWHDGEPFENYVERVPRFMSEYGFQSLPDWETLKQIAEEKDLKKNSAAIKSHQKHKRGFEIIDAYMKKHFGYIPDDFKEYVRLSQQLQSIGIIKGLTAHLKSQPRCMGSLIWQLNDCYPGISWSMIDYYGNKKIIFYEVKKTLDQTK